jgi:hypothetical protein
MTDRGQKALAERLHDLYPVSPALPFERYATAEWLLDAAAILGETGVYLPDGLDAAVIRKLDALANLAWVPLTDVERWQAIEAAARFPRNVVQFLGDDPPRFTGEWVAVPLPDFVALRTALERTSEPEPKETR